MMTLRAAALFGLLAISATRLTTCRSPGETTGDATPGRPEPKDVTLAGVDTSAFTSREKAEWSSLVSELLAPCPDQPVPLAQCVQESRPCRACTPAARFLVDQVKQGRTRTQAEAAYRARFSPDKVKNIELYDSPAKGAPDAPVVIVEWADFECPFCGRVKPVLDSVLDKYQGKVRVVFKHFPLSMHQNAEKAARSAVAAQRQGKFWELHGELFANQHALDAANVERMAQKVGLNLEQFKKDRDSEATADIVARDRKQGESLDIQGTPTIYINGRLFSSAQDFERELDDWIALEIELATGAPSAKEAKPAASTAPSAAPSAAPSDKVKAP